MFVDLREFPLPLCDGATTYGDPNVERLRGLVAEADGIILATPIYNYWANAAAKNAIELTGGAWKDKTVAFLCAAGGQSSYMAVLGLANSLMLDFRCVIVPRFVYATGEAFDAGGVTDAAVLGRIDRMLTELVSLAGGMKPVGD